MSWLTGEIDAYYDGHPCPEALAAAVRSASLVVPLAGDAPLCVADRGLVWICGFTSLRRLRAFAAARGDDPDHAEVPGERLLVRDGAALPYGLAVDLGSPRPMLFAPGSVS